VLDHLDAPVRNDRFRFVFDARAGREHELGLHAGATLSHRASRLRGDGDQLPFLRRDQQQVHRSLPNRRPRFYHSGETGDFDFVVRTLRAREPNVSILAAGASLGGNVLLKWLGEHPGQTDVAAAATFSVPYDLGAARCISKLVFFPASTSFASW